MAPFPVGSLVQTRNREWVVLPDSDDEFLVLQPVSGADREVAGVLPTLEDVKASRFPLPDISAGGSVEDWRLLRDAVRFGFRTSVGPFRSLARIGVTPRAYQLVPLMMALKLDPVRLLISDDVGIGKTVEALLVARELLDQGQVKRMAVLCSPSLAEQWQREMKEKFHIDAELVLTSTASDLERRCQFGESIFERFPFVVVSTDFIKADRRRNEFLDQAPELIIVDEAHDCAGVSPSKGATQRFEVVHGLSQDPTRHLLLLTATPHSGKTESFRNLLSLLDPRFADLPDDLSGGANEKIRRHLAQHFVQRRRSDIEHYTGEQTPFPERLVAEQTYKLSPEYRAFLNRVIKHARETVVDEQGNRRTRVRWWSILGLLRSLASSPAAASATLRNRSVTLEAASVAEVDELGRNAVLDLAGDDSLEGIDVVPGSDIAELDADAAKTRRFMNEMAREAERLEGPKTDLKLVKLVKMLKELIDEGRNPIVFCRFIPTAHYVAEHIQKALGKKVQVEAVTGQLAASEREERIAELSGRPGQHVLVATDCLSEGVNLQDAFDAVVHYDLAWNPTRHEQREGRVDRYGQPSPTVKAITYYGEDNGIDRIVLDVLLRKHASIRKATGVSVPVPGDSDGLVEALMEGLILRSDLLVQQLAFEGFEDDRREQLQLDWDNASEREKRSRHMFAQHSIKAEDVQAEVERVRVGLGSEEDLRNFLCSAILLVGGEVTEQGDVLAVQFDESSLDLRAHVPGNAATFEAKVALPVTDTQVHLTRTHPLVEALAARVLDAAISPAADQTVARSGSTSTQSVSVPTVVFLVRHRVLLTETIGGEQAPSLVEHCEFIAVSSLGDDPNWSTEDDVEALLADQDLVPLGGARGETLLAETIDHFDRVVGRLDERTDAIAANLLADHNRVREASKRTGVRYKAEAASTADVIGMYALLPRGLA
ncbi:DEAD/DEAH box helicase [Acidimicrobiaceae bacterium]|nr:DEAD/DEAH box helicase [Acidimicrobiaceae bacterium]